MKIFTRLPAFRRPISTHFRPRQILMRPSFLQLSSSKGYVEGTIPETLLKSSFFLTHVRKVLDKTGAPSYVDVQERAQIVRSPLHPQGVLPVFYYPQGVDCDGHGGGKAHYVIKFSYQRDAHAKPVTLRLGLECAADLASMPGKLPYSKKVAELFADFVQQKRALATVHASGNKSDLEREQKAFEQLKNRLGDALRRDNLDQIEKYNQEMFDREGESLREKLDTIEKRLWLFSDDPQIKLAVKQFAMDLKALESLAQGMRVGAVYMQQHLVDLVKDVYKKVVAATPELLIWPGYDLGMRTFINLQNTKEFIEKVEAADREFIAGEISYYRATISPLSQTPSRLGEISEEAAMRLKNLYLKLPQRGFLTRHALFTQFPELDALARIAKEDLKLLPAELAPRAKRIHELLVAIGRRNIILEKLTNQKPARAPVKKKQPGNNRARVIVDESEVPMMGGKNVFGANEAVGRLTKNFVEKTIEDLKFLQAHFKRKTEILSLYPNFEKNYQRLCILLPRIQKGDVPAKMGAVIDADAWPWLERKMVHYASLSDSGFFPTYICEKVEEMFARRASPTLRAATDEGFRGLVSRLRFETPKDRKAWAQFIKTHEKRLGVLAVKTFAPLAVLCSPKTKRGKIYSPIEIKALRLFDHALQRKLQRLDEIKKSDPTLYATLQVFRTLSGDLPPSHPADAAYFGFLYDRGYFDPKLRTYVDQLKIATATEDVVQTVNQARDVLARLQAWGLPLPEGEMRQARQAIAQFETTSAISDAGLRKLKAIAPLAPHGEATLEDKWHFVQTRLQGVQHTLPYFSSDVENMLKSRCTHADRLEILARLRTTKWPLATLRFFEAAALRHAPTGESAAREVFLEDEIATYRERIARINLAANSAAPLRANALRSLKDIAKEMPCENGLAKMMVGKIGQGLTFLTRDASGNFALTTHDEAIKVAAEIIRDNPQTYRALFEEDLAAKMAWPDTDQKNFHRIRTGATLAAAKLGFFDNAMATMHFGIRKGGLPYVREDRVRMLLHLGKSMSYMELSQERKLQIAQKLIEAMGDMFKTPEGWNLNISNAAKEAIIELVQKFNWKNIFTDPLKIIAASGEKTGKARAARDLVKRLTIS